MVRQGQVSKVMQKHTLVLEQTMRLECGVDFGHLAYEYHTIGTLTPNSKVIWVVHALTGNSNVYDWWPGLFGTQYLYSESDYFIICVNNLASCYGSSGPLSIKTNLPQFNYHNFPVITIRDQVRFLEILRKKLKIQYFHTLIGGSIGGMIALEWAIEQPTLAKHLILGAMAAYQTPWAIALNESQRMAIESDETWKDTSPIAATKGLETARSIALLSYRSNIIYNRTQEEETNDKTLNFKASSYQRYQGKKLSRRFDAFSYYRLTQAMDSHNVGRNRAGKEAALQQIQAKTLILGFSTDLLFPVEDQHYMAEHIPNAKIEIIPTLYGHDGFLIETEKISVFIRDIYQ